MNFADRLVTNAVRDCRPPKEGEPVEAARWSSLASALARVAQDGSTHGLAAHLSAFVASEVMGNLRCLSVQSSFVEKHPDVYEELVAAYKRMLERDDFKAFIAEGQIGGDWLGPEATAASLQQSYDVFSRYISQM